MAGLSVLFMLVLLVWTIDSFFSITVLVTPPINGSQATAFVVRGRLITSLRTSADLDYRFGRNTLSDRAQSWIDRGYPAKRAGFGLGRSPEAVDTQLYARVPTPYLIALSLGIAGWSAWRWRQIRRGDRIKAGRCPGCGYDLRASLRRCPECGRAVAGAGDERP